MSLTVRFVVGFCVSNSNEKVQSAVIRSNLNYVRQYAADMKSYVF